MHFHQNEVYCNRETLSWAWSITRKCSWLKRDQRQWHDCGMMFLKLTSQDMTRKFVTTSSSLQFPELQGNSLRLKLALSFFYSGNKLKLKKLDEQKGFEKWPKSKSVLCFVWYVFYNVLYLICRTFAVLRGNKVVLRHAVVNARTKCRSTHVLNLTR